MRGPDRNTTEKGQGGGRGDKRSWGVGGSRHTGGCPQGNTGGKGGEEKKNRRKTPNKKTTDCSRPGKKKVFVENQVVSCPNERKLGGAREGRFVVEIKKKVWPKKKKGKWGRNEGKKMLKPRGWRRTLSTNWVLGGRRPGVMVQEKVCPLGQLGKIIGFEKDQTQQYQGKKL